MNGLIFGFLLRVLVKPLLFFFSLVVRLSSSSSFSSSSRSSPPSSSSAWERPQTNLSPLLFVLSKTCGSAVSTYLQTWHLFSSKSPRAVKKRETTNKISFFIFPPLWLPDRHFGWFTGGEARENTAGFFCARFAHVLSHDWRGKHNNCCWWGQAFREKKNASKWYYNRVLIIRLLSEGFPCNQTHCWKVLGRARTVPVPDAELFSSFILQ